MFHMPDLIKLTYLFREPRIEISRLWSSQMRFALACHVHGVHYYLLSMEL